MSMAKRLGIVLLLCLSLFGSFFSTLWLTEPPIANAPPIKDDSGPVTERLAARQILNNADLITAAKSIGLYQFERMGGNVDATTRTNERDVRTDGWAADPDGDATPLSILIFVGGVLVAKAQTKGERPDVTRALRLFFGSEKNVSYSVSFACRPGDQPIIVAIGARGYISLNSRPCP
jgi:hypothetical protein